MAANVFGIPIDDDFVKALPDYRDKTITRFMRAQVALQYKNSGNKNVEAQTYVDNLKERYGNGVSTKCMFYNATGDNISFVTSHDYHGHLGESYYPSDIQNGQWGAFLHVHPTASLNGSSACVVYRGLNSDGDSLDWCLGWATNTVQNDKAFADVRAGGYYEKEVNWDNIGNLMDKHDNECHDTWRGGVAKASEGEGTTVCYVGLMTLENAGEV